MNKLYNPLVSVILPIYNGECWLAETFASILHQQFHEKIEVCIFNDASLDWSSNLIEEYAVKCELEGIACTVLSNATGSPKGVGYSRNRAVECSNGKYLCFHDCDDVMLPQRIAKQYAASLINPDAIIGTKFVREPKDSTARFTLWANRLTPEQLFYQAYTSHGPTVIMPTWFCSRTVFDRIGGFDESGKGVPEDLIFFYEHIRLGGELYRVDEPLVVYRYHHSATTHSVLESTIWDLRVAAIQRDIIDQWNAFTIWNAGKQGRRLYRSLSEVNQNKVTCFCDVDAKKINQGFYTYAYSKKKPKPKVPIVHYTQAYPPFIICVKLDLTAGDLEKNLQSLNLVEGRDYVHFN